MRCTRCLLPDSKPDLHFNEDGVCSACQSFDAQNEVDWGERSIMLNELLARHDNKCIVASSGGKDSSAIVHILKERGADVMCATAQTCHISPIGHRNIDTLARFAETVVSIPNMTVRRKLNRRGLELVGDISWPEHVAIFTVPIKVALATGRTLVFYGENPQNAYGGPPGSDQALEMTRRWVSEFGGFLGLRPSDMIGDGVTARDMEYYAMPDETLIKETGTEAHFFGQYVRWDSHRNFAIAREHGFEFKMPSNRNFWPWENLDNVQTGIHDWVMQMKYGYSRACSQLSVDIRMGFDRTVAMQIMYHRETKPLRRYLGVELGEILAPIGLTVDEFLKICQDFYNVEAQDYPDPCYPWEAGGEGAALQG
jgi:hypothetical protein